MNLVDEAILLATRAHYGQCDKAGHPYITHPLRVMSQFVTPRLRMAAVLHDVLEDTDLTAGDLASHGIPPEVIRAVQILSHVGNEANVVYWARIAANPLARAVKLADIADNSDETRLVCLPAETAARLRVKYQRARVALGADR